MALSAVPGIKVVSEAVVGPLGQLMNHAGFEQPSNPCFAGRASPNLNRAIYADEHSSFLVHAVQTPPHSLDINPESC